MKSWNKILITVVFGLTSVSCTDPPKVPAEAEVLVVIPARNEEHILPYFFGYFEKLSYPKEKMSLFIRSDHNQDDTPAMLDTWISAHGDDYHSINVNIKNLPKEYNSTYHWPTVRYETLINIKEQALTYARLKGIRYIFFLDTDALLTNEDVIQDLIDEQKPIIAPMLQSRSAYSNFWGEMDENGYYVRSKDYIEMVERTNTGTFVVSLVHSAVFVDLKSQSSSKLTFSAKKVDPSGKIPVDDIIAFARSAQKAGVEQFVTNKKNHGYIMYSTETSNKENMELLNLKLEVTRYGGELLASEILRPMIRYPVRDSLGVDQVYLINLLRREDRYKRMKYCFDNLGVRFKHIPAVDGKKMSTAYKNMYGIQQLIKYEDPYHKRNITTGEIGCFMSHFNVWSDIIENNYDHAIVFEDDIHFEPYFRAKVEEILYEIGKQDLDLVYFGRKRLVNASEPYLEGTEKLVQVDYSYWTLSYYITKNGARKLLDGEPLSKMVPVDEYLPIMFDRHPRKEWKEAFEPRNLKAASAYPLLVYPTHYTGEENYISDTEDSPLLDEIEKLRDIPDIQLTKEEL